MILIKILLLFLVLCGSAFIGILISAKYKNRVKELKEIKKALNIFETKIRFTCEPIPEIFQEMGKSMTSAVENIFQKASFYMKEEIASKAWEKSLQESATNLNAEDLEVLKGMGKLLGKTDLEGQVSQIELTTTFLDGQIHKAEKECEKNEKLYKTLRNGNWSCLSYYFNINKRKDVH